MCKNLQNYQQFSRGMLDFAQISYFDHVTLDVPRTFNVNVSASKAVYFRHG